MISEASSPKDVDDSLAGKATRGLLATSMGSWSRFIVQFGTVIVVARLLGPSEYAASALVVMVMAIAEMLRTTGIAAAIIQSPNITNSQIVTLDHISSIIGAIFGVVILALSPLYGVFVGRYWLVSGILLGISMVFSGSSTAPTALLTRKMEYSRLISAEVIAMFLGCAAALLCAFTTRLSISLVAQSLVYCLVMWVMVRKGANIAKVKAAPLNEVKDFLKFGGAVGFVQLLSAVSRNLDRIIVGYLFGSGAAGIYSQANQLLTIPLDLICGPVQKVALPVLSKVVNDAGRFVSYYRHIVSLLVLILWPFFTVLIVMAPQTVSFLFGQGWSESADIFRILAISGFSQPIGYVSVWVFVSSGNVKLQTIWALVSRPLVLLSFFIGAPWGLLGVALAYSICELFIVIPGFLLARKGTKLQIRDMWSPLLLPAVVAPLSGLAAYVGTLLFTDMPLQLFMSCFFAVSVWLMCIFALPPTRRTMLSTVKSLKKSRA